jgi:hypothetical protein
MGETPPRCLDSGVQQTFTKISFSLLYSCIFNSHTIFFVVLTLLLNYAKFSFSTLFTYSHTTTLVFTISIIHIYLNFIVICCPAGIHVVIPPS